MKNNYFIILIIVFLACQGCVPLLAVGAGAYTIKKAKSKPRKLQLSEMQRRVFQTHDFEGKREDVLRATVTIFQDRGYNVTTSDYEGGIISATSEKPFIQVNAMVEEFIETRIKMRITLKDAKGVVEDEIEYMKLFDDIQTEIFRRINVKN